MDFKRECEESKKPFAWVSAPKLGCGFEETEEREPVKLGGGLVAPTPVGHSGASETFWAGIRLELSVLLVRMGSLCVCCTLSV